MARLDIALFEWPDDPTSSGPRLLGRISDADLVRTVRDRLVSVRQRELAKLARPDKARGERDSGGR